jgi:hypothetical protein
MAALDRCIPKFCSCTGAHLYHAMPAKFCISRILSRSLRTRDISWFTIDTFIYTCPENVTKKFFSRVTTPHRVFKSCCPRRRCSRPTGGRHSGASGCPWARRLSNICAASPLASVLLSPIQSCRWGSAKCIQLCIMHECTELCMQCVCRCHVCVRAFLIRCQEKLCDYVRAQCPWLFMCVCENVRLIFS